MIPGTSKVYIIGFMGSGKTTAGKRLAASMGWSFIDLDSKIEETCGKSVPDIFSESGEAYFRNVESEVLKSLINSENTIISTGGGTPCFNDNMDFMLNSGLTIYLKLTPGQLKSRLSESGGERPLIKGLNHDDLHLFIVEKLTFRETWYNKSQITVEGINLNINLLKYLVKENLKI